MSRLTGAGEVPLASVVHAVAHDLYQDALRHGGWAAEIGGAGRGLFASDAAEAMREADGVLWSIRGSASAQSAEAPRRS